MNDATLRNAIIRLAHARPEFRAQLLPLLKTAGCEKLPEGGMRDNCEKKKEEGAKSDDGKKASAVKLAIKPDTEAFIQWVHNTQGQKSPQEVEKFINNVLHIDTAPEKVKDPDAVKGPRFKSGDPVEIKAHKHTNAATQAVYDQYHGKIGTVTSTDGMDVLVEFKAGAAPVRFPGGMLPRGVGIYKYAPAYTIEGSPMMEMVYLPDPSAKPSHDAKAVVEVYVGKAKGIEQRSADYYTGSVTGAAISPATGFYFRALPQQRTNVDPAAEGQHQWRTFNPRKGAVLYIGLMGKRPSDWKKQLSAIEEKIEEVTGETAKAASKKA